MLETKILNALTDEQKQKITNIITHLNRDNLSNYIQTYVIAFDCPPDQAREDFEKYMELRALVALEWAYLFSYYFRHGGWESALKLRLAYDLQNPQSLSPNLLNYLLEQTLSLFTHMSIEARVLLILAPLYLTTFGSAALFIGTGVLIGLGLTIPFASSIFLLSTAIALIGAGLLIVGEKLLDSKYNIRWQYLSKDYDEPRPFSRLESWHSACDKSCIDVAEDDRHARPFDKLGFFKDYDAKSAHDMENELTQALTC